MTGCAGVPSVRPITAARTGSRVARVRATRVPAGWRRRWPGMRAGREPGSALDVEFHTSRIRWRDARSQRTTRAADALPGRSGPAQAGAAAHLDSRQRPARELRGALVACHVDGARAVRARGGFGARSAQGAEDADRPRSGRDRCGRHVRLRQGGSRGPGGARRAGGGADLRTPADGERVRTTRRLGRVRGTPESRGEVREGARPPAADGVELHERRRAVAGARHPGRPGARDQRLHRRRGARTLALRRGTDRRRRQARAPGALKAEAPCAP